MGRYGLILWENGATGSRKVSRYLPDLRDGLKASNIAYIPYRFPYESPMNPYCKNRTSSSPRVALEPVAPFSQSISPSRSTAVPFVPNIMCPTSQTWCCHSRRGFISPHKKQGFCVAIPAGALFFMKNRVLVLPFPQGLYFSQEVQCGRSQTRLFQDRFERNRGLGIHPRIPRIPRIPRMWSTTRSSAPPFHA